MITRRAPLTAKVQWFLSVCFACLACLAGLLPLHAAEFTTPITLSETDTPHDGQDIVINNTTATIDGAHSFNSLLLTNNAVLTHSACTANGTHKPDLRLANAVVV